MEFNREDDLTKPPEPQKLDSSGFHSVGTNPPPLPAQPQAKKGSGWRIFWGIILFFSVIANFALLLMLVGVVAIFAGGRSYGLHETVIRNGPAGNKIAVISLEGVIYGDMAQNVYEQLRSAAEDSRVRGIIVRINSPGGTISASDQIYREIQRFRKEHGKPVVAFMQGVAASGGYYASVACERIIAEPTAITGSIGVISWWIVVQELLEDKLGVLPVTVKSGPKKDWPSSFRAPTPEEITYMDERLIKPAFERFIDVIEDGRSSVMSRDEILAVADGGIFVAEMAKDNKLIDQVGYLEDAVEYIKSKARISQARVVEYRRPFSLMDIMSYNRESLLKIDKNTIYEMSSPKVLYLWTSY